MELIDTKLAICIHKGSFRLNKLDDIFNVLSKKLTKGRKELLFTIIGLVIGISLTLMITLLPLTFTIYLQLANLILTAMILLRLQDKKQKTSDIQNPQSSYHCPECGAHGRHRKDCSKRKKQ
jgi:hypothetical protein